MAHCSPNVPTTCAATDTWAPLGVVNTHKYGWLSRHSPAMLMVDVTEIDPLLGMTLVTSMVVHGGRIGSEQSTPVQPSKHTHPMLQSHRPRPLQYPGHFFNMSSRLPQLWARRRDKCVSSENALDHFACNETNPQHVLCEARQERSHETARKLIHESMHTRVRTQQEP